MEFNNLHPSFKFEKEVDKLLSFLDDSANELGSTGTNFGDDLASWDFGSMKLSR